MPFRQPGSQPGFEIGRCELRKDGRARPGQAASRQADPPVALARRRFRADSTAPPGACRQTPARRLRRRRPGSWRRAATDEEQLRIVRMAVQDEFGPVPAHGLLEERDAEQPLVLRNGAAYRRMVDHDHPEQAALGRRVEHSAEPLRLALPEEAVGHERGGGARRRNADQRDVAAYPQIGKSMAVDRCVDVRRRSSTPPRNGRTCRRRPAHRHRDCPERPTRHAANPASPASSLAISISPSSARLTRSPVTAR